MGTKKEIFVYMDCDEDKTPRPMGVLYREMLRGKELFSFEYDSDWLKRTQSRFLDPDLSQFTGKQYLPPDKSNFGLFLDSSPDRWGRTLMIRRESIMAREEKRPVHKLTETDFLMGIYDGNRMGALRFKFNPAGEFMDSNKAMATPPWASIRDLERACAKIEKDDLRDEVNTLKWLNMLVAPGSSLGGARPKASIVDENGALWIAKFPSNNDTKDVGAWEALTAELAMLSGVLMAESKAQHFYSKQHTFLTKRFDRRVDGSRVHFASAMSLLGYTDGTKAADGVSYLELAEWISRYCCNVEENLIQLWRRVVFNIAVSNCDDHLRNHGFLLTPKGWTLSPAYDINPDEYGMGLKLNISEGDNSLNFELALSTASYYGLNREEAEEILKQVKTVVSSWKSRAAKWNIARREQELMAHAFNF